MVPLFLATETFFEPSHMDSLAMALPMLPAPLPFLLALPPLASLPLPVPLPFLLIVFFSLVFHNPTRHLLPCLRLGHFKERHRLGT